MRRASARAADERRPAPRCSGTPRPQSGRASANGTIVPAPDASMSCAYQYGVETTPQPAASANVERAGRDLLARTVRRHEDVGRREQIGDLVDAEEAVVELDVILEPEVEHGPLQRQPVALALAVRDVGVRPAGDQVEHVRMASRRSPATPRSRSRAPCRPRSARTWRAGTGRRAGLTTRPGPVGSPSAA